MKRILSILAVSSVALTLGCKAKQSDPGPAPQPVAQDGSREQEPNNSFGEANQLQPGEFMNGSVNMSGDMEDWFKLDAPAGATLKFTFTSGTKPESIYITYTVYDEKREQVLKPGSVDVNAGVTETREVQVSEGGTWPLRVDPTGPKNDYKVKFE